MSFRPSPRRTRASGDILSGLFPLFGGRLPPHFLFLKPFPPLPYVDGGRMALGCLSPACDLSISVFALVLFCGTLRFLFHKRSISDPLFLHVDPFFAMRPFFESAFFFCFVPPNYEALPEAEGRSRFHPSSVTLAPVSVLPFFTPRDHLAFFPSPSQFFRWSVSFSLR